jgi:hypothetical protein
LTDTAIHVSAPRACKITNVISITAKQWSSVAMRSVRLSPMTQQALLLTVVDLNDSMVERHATVSAKWVFKWCYKQYALFLGMKESV